MIAVGADDLEQGRVIKGDDFFGQGDTELDEMEASDRDQGTET